MSSSSDPSPGKRNSEKTPDEVDKLREQVDALHTELPDLCWPSVNGWVKQYGFELVVLAIELLSRLVRHPKASDRPKTARYARKALDKWHTWLGERKPDQVPEAFRVEVLTYIRAEIEAQTRDCPKPHAPCAASRQRLLDLMPNKFALRSERTGSAPSGKPCRSPNARRSGRRSRPRTLVWVAGRA